MLLLLGGGIYYEKEGIKEKKCRLSIINEIIFFKEYIIIVKTYLKFNS
jgi:hypothetical protein